jgi:hypothetical protein
VVTWPGKPTAGTGGTCRDGPKEEEEPLHACLCQKAFPFLGCKAIIKEMIYTKPRTLIKKMVRFLPVR